MDTLSHTSRKILSNTVYQVIGKFISMSVTLFATVVITRVYGREGYGMFNLMQTWPALFFIIVDFGINAIATKELSTDWSKAQKYFSNILVFRMLFSLLVMLVVGVAVIFFPYISFIKIGIYLSLFLIMTQALYATVNIIFQVKLRYDLSTYGYIFGSLVLLLLVIIFSSLRLNIIWISFSYVLGGIAVFIANMFFVKRLGVGFRFEFDSGLIKHLFAQSLPLGLMFIFSQVNFKVDSILLSAMDLPKDMGLNNTESVAVYGLSYKIFEVLLVVPTFFMNAVYPVLIRHMNEGKDRLKNTFFKVLSFISIAGTGIGLITYFASPIVIQLLAGISFSYSVDILKIFSTGLVLFYMTQPLSWLIVTLGGQRYLPYVYMISAVFNVFANIAIIPIYSFFGSSIVTLLSEFLILIMLMYIARRVWKQCYA